MVKAEAHQEYIRWLNLPMEERDPPSKKKFAFVHRVDRSVLRKWEIELAKQMANPDADKVKGFMEDIYAKRKDSPQYAKLWADMKGLVVDRKEIKQEIIIDFHTQYQNFIEGLRESLREYGGICPVCSKPYALSGQTRSHTDENESPQEDEVGTLAIPAGFTENIS